MSFWLGILAIIGIGYLAFGPVVALASLAWILVARVVAPDYFALRPPPERAEPRA